MQSEDMGPSALDKPTNVEQIVRLASEPFFDEQYPILRWFRTADVMVKQVVRATDLSLKHY